MRRPINYVSQFPMSHNSPISPKNYSKPISFRRQKSKARGINATHKRRQPNGGHRENALMILRFLSPWLTVRKKSKLFLRNFANGDHRESAVMTLRVLSPCLTFGKKSKIIFAKSRKWWPSRNRHHDTAPSFVLLDAQKKVEIDFTSS